MINSHKPFVAWVLLSVSGCLPYQEEIELLQKIEELESEVRELEEKNRASEEKFRQLETQEKEAIRSLFGE